MVALPANMRHWILKTTTPGALAGRLASETPVSGVLKIGGGLLAALGDDLVRDALALVDRAHAGALDGGDVHEHVLGAVGRGDEAEALLGVEELHGTCCHDGVSLKL